MGPLTIRTAVLLCIACIGLMHVPYPFGGDQAVFALGARTMHEGGVLYRDYWDLKQPGIFVFYLAAGRLLGFSNVGVHVFELAYALAFAGILLLTLGGTLQSTPARAAAPLLAIGLYYANATPFTMTQVEWLAGFPLYLAMHFALKGGGTQRVLYGVTAGICGAIVLWFKLLFLPLLIAIWLPAIGTMSSRVIAAMILAFLAGNALWMSESAVSSGASTVAATFFGDPIAISRTLPAAPLGRLVQSIQTFALGWLVAVAAAAIGVLAERRTGTAPLVRSCVVWIAAGLAVILAQRQSWWQYQFDLLTVPLAILAAFGIDALDGWARRRRSRVFWTACAALLLLAFPLKHTATAFAALEQADFAVNPAARERFARAIDPGNHAGEETRFLRAPGAQAGDIYVFGDPRYYFAARRRQAVSISGWAAELLQPAQWRQLRAQLQERRPPYIFVSAFYRSHLPLPAFAPARAILTRYRLLHRDAAGDWYEFPYKGVGGTTCAGLVNDVST